MTPITIEPKFKVVDELNIPTHMVKLDEFMAEYHGKTEVETYVYGGDLGVFVKPGHESGLEGWHGGAVCWSDAHITKTKESQLVEIVFDEMFHKDFHEVIDQLEATSFDVFFDGETVLVKPL